MDVHEKLDEITSLVEQARAMPMSASCIVNRPELLTLLEELRALLPQEIDLAEQLLAGREKVVEEGRSEADRIIAAAQDERIEMLHQVTAQWPNVVVDSYSGLLVDFCRDHGIPAVVKGLRAVSDFDYELQMAQMNRQLAGVETLFVPTSATYSYLSSSLLKEVAALGGDVAGLVPDVVATRLRERLASR